jgi:hypothetical protein
MQEDQKFQPGNHPALRHPQEIPSQHPESYPEEHQAHRRLPHGYPPHFQYPPRPSIFSQTWRFISPIFDITFSTFITSKLISMLYIASIVVAALSTLSVVIGGFAADVTGGVIVLVLSPLIFLVQLVWFRVLLEIVVIIFKIAESLRSIDQKFGPKQG